MPNDQERLATLEAIMGGHTETLKKVVQDISDIKDKLLLRPSWAVLTIITILTTICTGLIVYVATNTGSHGMAFVLKSII